MFPDSPFKFQNSKFVCLSNIESVSSDPSSPEEVSEDRGSSITSSLLKEYEDLLRYAVVKPIFNGPVSKNTKTTPSSSQRLGVHSTQGNLLFTLFMIMKLICDSDSSGYFSFK